MTDSNSPSPRVLELADEFLDRYRRGERPPLGEYAARYPELASEIREVFPAIAMMERIALADESIEGRRLPPGPSVRIGLSQLGDFRILREVGRGGMGVVFEAEQVSLGRHVALKVLPERLLADPKQRSRFEREAKAAARLHHTNIVPVFGVGEDDGTPYYAMQFIAGLGLDQVIKELRRQRVGEGSLGDTPAAAGLPGDLTITMVARSLLGGQVGSNGREGMVDEGATGLHVSSCQPEPVAARSGDSSRLSSSSGSFLGLGSVDGSRLDDSPRPTYWRGVARIGSQVADALAYAHSQGIVHRDIKPSNLLLDARGVVWVTDFGLAKVEDQEGLTHTGDILGTLRYMPPEAFEGRHDARGDVYSLGLSLYEMLAFRPAFDEADRGRLVRQVTFGEPPRLRTINPEVPRDLETVVHRAIERDPSHRYQTAAILAEDLRRYMEDRPILARRASESEKIRRWCRRNPVPASLLATLFLVFWAGFGLVTWKWREAVAEREAKDHERLKALAAEKDAGLARDRAEASRSRADAARDAALAETYRASISEARSLRAAHPPGWRDDALGNLARLATLPTPRRNLFELRSEAVACLGEFDIREIARLDCSQGVAFGLDFLADGRTLATAHLNGVVRLWDVAKLEHLAMIPGEGPIGNWNLPSGNVPWPTVKRRPDGKGLTHNPRGHGAISLGIPDLQGNGASIDREGRTSRGLAYDATGRRLAIGWDDDRIEVFDVATGSRIRSEASNWPRAFALSPDGRWLGLTGPEDTIRLVDVDDKSPPVILGKHRQRINSIAFSPDGATLATASDDNSVILWDLARREPRFPLLGHKGAAECVTYSPDGEWIVTGGRDHSARVWDARSGRELAVLEQGQGVIGVAFSPGGDYLATSCVFSTSFHLYRITGRGERRWLLGHTANLQSVAFHPRLDSLASGDDFGRIFLWDPKTGKPIRNWAGHSNNLSTHSFSPDGSLLASASADKEVRLWNAVDGSLVRTLSAHDQSVTSLAFDATGTRLATGDFGGHIQVWEVATGAKLGPGVDKFNYIRSIAFVGEGGQLLAQVFRGELWLLDPMGRDSRRLDLMAGGSYGFVSDRGRSRVIVAGTNGHLVPVSLPDLIPGHQVKEEDPGEIKTMAMSPDGKVIATAGEAGLVVLYDAATLQPLLRFPRQTGWVTALAFDSSGNQLAVVGATKEVMIWDLGLIRVGLDAVGLDWDHPAPVSDPSDSEATHAESVSKVIPLITTTDSVNAQELAKANSLLGSGIRIVRAGRPAEAIVSFQGAIELFRQFAPNTPSDQRVAGRLANALGWLGGALDAAGRPEESRAATLESRTILEGLTAPTGGELYDLACAYSRISGMIPTKNSAPTESERKALADRAIATLRRSIEQGLPANQNIEADYDFDPIRNRADFRELILDLKFPRDPFARL